MNIKRIVLSLGIIAIVGIVGFAGTRALFYDEEVSNANTFSAGSINLAIGSNFSSESNGSGSFALDSDNNGRTLFTFDDLKPGDRGTVVFHMEVTSNDAYACALSESGENRENGINDAERDAGDITAGPNGGELQNYLQFATFADLNNNDEYDENEPVNVNQYGGDGDGFTAAQIAAAGWIPVADASSPNTWTTQGVLAANTTHRAGLLYCFGKFETTGNGTQTVVTGCDEIGEYNDSQTDIASGSITFRSFQARNNEGFLCSSLNEEPTEEESTSEVSESELFTINDRVAAFASQGWFFYNDTNDTIMSINQFAGDGANEMDNVDGVEGAKMTLHDGTARYNIATYKYNNVKLADIDTLLYRIYDADASSQTPYLHFNVSFDGVDNWQRRLVQIPTGVTPNTWTTVDAIGGGSTLWTWSYYADNGNKWPDGNTDEYRTWSDITSTWPNAQIRATDAFFGVRVGHPGPIGETGYVDWINFNGEITDFVE